MVPKLRFKNYNRIEEKKIINFAPLQRGYDLPISQIEDGDYPVVFSNGILKKHSKYKVKGPGIVTGRSGTIGKVTYVQGNFWPHNTSLFVTDFFDNIPKYVYYYYQHIDFSKFATGSGVPTLNRNDLHSLTVLVPAIEEQTKIADFLSSVDEKITLLNKQYNLLCQYKKGMMQKIFNQEVRFRDENGDIFPAWQENILSNLGNAYSGLTGKTAEDFGKGTFYITYKQIFDNRIIQPKDFGLVCISKNEKQNKVKYGDLFFTTSSETPGEVAFCSVFLETEMSDCYLNSFCFGYRLKNIDKNHPVFLSFLFRSEYFRAKVKTLAQGSTRYNISKAQFMMLSVNIPVTKEQTKIANFLSALDDKIAIKKVELDRLKTWKQGMLQQMFV